MCDVTTNSQHRRASIFIWMIRICWWRRLRRYGTTWPAALPLLRWIARRQISKNSGNFLSQWILPWGSDDGRSCGKGSRRVSSGPHWTWNWESEMPNCRRLEWDSHVYMLHIYIFMWICKISSTWSMTPFGWILWQPEPFWGAGCNRYAWNQRSHPHSSSKAGSYSTSHCRKGRHGVALIWLVCPTWVNFVFENDEAVRFINEAGAPEYEQVAT